MSNANTVEATVTVQFNGQVEYQFADTYDMDIALGATSLSPIVIQGSASADRIQLQSSANNTLYGDAGNDTYVIGNQETSLNGNVIRGGAGFNQVQINASGTTVDLTNNNGGIQNQSAGIAAVVANDAPWAAGGGLLTGEVVDLNMNNLISSGYTDGVSSHGDAFIGLLGRDGVVNFTTPSNVTFVGSVDGSGAGWDATGGSITGGALTTLESEVTGINGVEGTLAYLFTGAAKSSPLWSYLPDNLAAYVFQSGTTFYTIWTDGTITQSNDNGTPVGTLYQPGAVTGATSTFGTVTSYNANTAGFATVTENPVTGAPILTLGNGQGKSPHVVFKGGDVSGTIVHSPGGAEGDFFNLQDSGGGNQVFGGAKGDLYELGSAPALIDQLWGEGGFNLVTASAPGADVNLTASNTTAGGPASDIQGFVGEPTAPGQTVEVNLTSLQTTSPKPSMSIFEALFGPGGTLTVSSSGGYKWYEIGTFTPGSTLPPFAVPLTDASTLDSLYGAGNTTTAESSMVGYLFETVDGVKVRYDTIWTNGSLVFGSQVFNGPVPAVVKMATAMASFAPSKGVGGTSLSAAAIGSNAVTLVQGR